MRTIHFLPHSGILCGQWRGGATKPRLPRLSFGLLQLQSLDLESHESHGSHGHPTTVSLFSKPLAESSWSFWYHLLQDQLDPVRHCSRLQITQVDSLRHHWETKSQGRLRPQPTSVCQARMTIHAAWQDDTGDPTLHIAVTGASHLQVRRWGVQVYRIIKGIPKIAMLEGNIS